MQEIYKNNEEDEDQMQPTLQELELIVDQIIGRNHKKEKDLPRSPKGQKQQMKYLIEGEKTNQDSQQVIQQDKTGEWIKEEEYEFFNTNLKNLGLTEKKGLDGIEMLYPVENKQKQLEKEDIDALVQRLYKPKPKQDPYFNMNKQAKKQIKQQQQKMNQITQVKSQISSIHGNTNASGMSTVSKKSKGKKNNDVFENMILF
ncbi:hypothetical protein PPERSA_11355 [Pseudocohnilembus persalinus]|uniref:Uncharacterized protein n=1 Tax=Pseudocohnilembus persalinus TaxID=266149 RepID=A0A0V0QQ58_PSEPJ|nr:hypothetical protein PPERSA_11355 [Pseudocohnilembus persalinus]|eukprot:KRX04231.1 hypothetical protein PPERSA_11355 [Pseudocohnilembus persalinus]